ncbi:hypothetical protein MNBD_GAMMA12-3017 [hydrothermal vent metagenome]|uniref:DUF2802 domain-containing protein n=1 Tax=hydrothermal vent metagenome TaxID=652676 RepID=A0A3B0Y6L1_9ZZZZ
MLFIMTFLGIAITIIFLSFQKRSKKEAVEYDRKLRLLARELNQLRKSLVDPINRLYESEQRSRRITERLEQLELREKSSRQYGQAAKLVNNGSSVEDIMDICGLNRGEAELIKVMNELDNTEEAETKVM